MGALADTPLEIIDQIFSFATATDPPSVTCLREQPSLALLASQQCPVKNTSSTCRKLRRLCFNRLFSYLKIDASYTDALIAFVNYYNLVQYVESVVLYTKEQHLEGVAYHYDQDIPDTTREMSPASQLKPAILAVMEHINPKSLVIMASPRSFANLVPYPVNLSDSWAFNIPNQILRLEQNDPTLPPSTFPLVLDFDIFAIRPWRRITYNEGSSIPAYCTYEYFNKCRPSLLATPYSETGLKAKSWLAYLTSLNFVAVFPFGHIEDVCQSLRSLQNLKYLAIQLAPSTTNGILDDRVALATCQRSDVSNI